MAEKSNIIPLHKEDDEFEMLAAEALCDELTPEREARLKTLLAGSETRRRRFHELTETNLFLASFPPGSIGVQESSTSPTSAPPLRRSSARNRTLLSVAAAGILIAIGLAAFFFPRSGQTDAVTGVHGSCASNGNPALPGKKQNIDLVVTGAVSYCDVMLAATGDVNIRIFPESKVRMHRTEKSTIIVVDAGGILLDAGKRKSEVIVRAKNTAVQLLGTKIAVTTGRGEVQVSVLSGSTRVFAGPSLMDASSETFSSADLEAAAQKTTNGQSQVVETGQTAEIKQSPSPIRVESTQPETRFLLLRAQSGFVETPRSLEPGAALDAMGDAQKQTPPVLYRLHLKNGSVVTGRVEQKENQYRVMTEEKDITVDQDQVENLELFQKD